MTCQNPTDKQRTIFSSYWGKYTDDIGYHLLPYHNLDVVAVADVWLSHSNVILSQSALLLNKSHETTRRIILFFIALHDLGKFDARFQEFLPHLREELQGKEFEVDPESYPHGSYGYLHFQREFGNNENMMAVAGHHGSCNQNLKYFLPDADAGLIEQDKTSRQQWIEFCLQWFDLENIPEVQPIQALAGLCSVSDWVGSSMTNYSQDQNVDYSSYYENALKRGRIALQEAGLINSQKGSGFSFLFPTLKPRGVQTLLPKLPLQSGLTLVESDTGSGKTEFALAYASMLVNKGLADGVVFALPTQATANGLFKRIGSAAQVLFPDCQTTLAHGKSKYQIPDENGFLHQSNKRAFLGSVSVATIDQILMGVLNIKHQFVRSFGTQKSVLIMDEVHSFDAYMRGLIKQVMVGQHSAIGSIILLSATLTHETKQNLMLPYNGSPNSYGYPLVTHVSAVGEVMELPLESSTGSKCVKLQQWQSESLLPNKTHQLQLIQWAKAGAMVAVICNTVLDAQIIYAQIISSSDIVPDLFHARFTTKDRQAREELVLNKYDKHAPREGGLLIATQVVEQSLDLDFDIIVSQIAPIEFLMQRMGRLWRHDRTMGNTSALAKRSLAIPEPQFITLCPTLEQVTDNYSNAYLSSGYIYGNLRAMYRTQCYLTELEGRHLQFPFAYRDALEWVYHDLPYQDESPQLLALANEYENSQAESFYAAILASNQTATPLSDVDPRAALLTREGEMSQQVVLFNESGQLFHGGDYDQRFDRENSSVSLSRKLAKGVLDTEYYCLKAVVGKDVSYQKVGVFDERFTQAIPNFNENKGES